MSVASLPPAFLCRMERMLGMEFPAFLSAMRGSGAAAIRLNPARPGAREAVDDLISEPVPWCEAGWYVREGVRPGADLRHTAGLYYVQEASAMAAAMVLRPAPGELVLDLCAAPGGKSGQLAAMAENGVLVANEIDPVRARALSSNLERLGVVNAAVVSESPERLAQRWPEAFDAVQVDAPCSGEGMFRRDPGAIEAWSERAPEGCAERQAGILDQAAKLIKPGGRMCYSTCTFSELENERTVERFLLRHLDFEPMDFYLPGVGASERGMLRLWPHRVRGDGHFVALMRRQGCEIGFASKPAFTTPAQTVRKLSGAKNIGSDRGVRGDRPTMDLAMQWLLRDVLVEWPVRFTGLSIALNGDELIAVPPRIPSLQGLRVLRHGLKLAHVGAGYLQPDHALAMALLPGEVQRGAELSPEWAARALAGEALPGAGRGWTLLTFRGLSLGWVKACDGILKNHIPKGLRRPS